MPSFVLKMRTSALLLLAAAGAHANPCDIYDAAPEKTPCVAAHSESAPSSAPAPLSPLPLCYSRGAAPLVAAPRSALTLRAAGTVRALYAKYAGPLDQVKKADGSLKNITVLAPGGFADSAAQDTFCSSACVIQRIFDQSPMGNHLDIA